MTSFSLLHLLQQVVESAAGAAVAALFTDQFNSLPRDVVNVAVILCGGNTDIDNLPWYPGFKKGY